MSLLPEGASSASVGYAQHPGPGSLACVYKELLVALEEKLTAEALH